MEKNQFLMINDIIYDIYSWEKLSDINETFFKRLQMLLPFSYGSLFFHKGDASSDIELSDPVCYPAYFAEAEQAYLKSSDDDYLLWILHARESKLIRESDIIDDADRLNSPLYRGCYHKYDIYDSMQLTIVHHGRLYGVLSLFRTKSDGTFSNDDMFFLQSLGMHLNLAISRLIDSSDTHNSTSLSVSDFSRIYGLTSREADIFQALTHFIENKQIAATMNISENTLQKHLQNLFRKFGVGSKWELMKKINE